MRHSGCWMVLLLSLLLGLLFGPQAAAEESDAEDPITSILAHFADKTQLQGRFTDVVTQPDAADDEAAAEAHTSLVQFWLAAPDRYHFIVRARDDDDEDRQHYLSDGQRRVQVEVVLDHALVDEQPINADDPFARVQRLVQLDRTRLEEDFVLTHFDLAADADADADEQLPAAVAAAFPAAWETQQALWLQPHSPDMRSELQQVWLAFDAELQLRGLVVDDHRGNRRTVTIDELAVPEEDLDPALFRWQEGNGS